MYKFLSILCVSSLPFLFSLHGDFVFDDSEAIVKNKHVFNGSWTDSFFKDFWGTDISSHLSHKSYRPLTILSFRLNYVLSGYQLIPYHFKITNLVCHVICSLLAWKTFYKILKKPNKQGWWWMDDAYLSALLFSVHPIHTEAVSGIVGRADILAGITFFLAILAYVKAMETITKYSWLYLVIAIIISGMSMIFKENGVTVLGLCMVYDLVCKLKMKRSDLKIILNRYTSTIIRITVVLIALAILLYGRWMLMGGTIPEFQPIDNPAAFSETFSKISTYNYIYFLNILLLIWPYWLCYDWSMGCVPLIESTFDYRLIFVLFMYLYGILLIMTLLNSRNGIHIKRQFIMALSLIILPFMPAANIFYPVGFVIAERILYIPSAGYCCLIVIGLGKMMRNRISSKICIIFYIILLLTFGLKSWQRSFYWQNEYYLFTSGLSVCPKNAKVRYNVAKVADGRRNTDWALREYKTAISLYPEYHQAMNNLANLLKNLQQFDEAEYYLRKAISINQEFPAAWMNLGIVLANTKRYNKSYDAYITALKYRSNYPDCLYNLGNLHLEMNDTKAALDTWFEAIKLSPQHNLAWTNLLALLDNTGQVQKAMQIIPRVLAELPASPSVNFAIANIYGKLEKYEDAERHFLLAIKLFDKKVQAIHYANLGVLYHRWKKYSLAKEMYEKSLNIDPHFKSASRNLQSVLKYI